MIGGFVRSPGVATWLMVTHAQSLRSLVVKYGFDACSPQVGLPENGKRGVNPSRRWKISDVPLKSACATVAPPRQFVKKPVPLPVAGASSLNTSVEIACSIGIGLPL